MPLPKLVLASHRDQRIVNGHLWIFSNEIEQKDKDIQPGATVDVYNHRQHFLGRGFYNAQSLIAARLMTREDEQITRALIERRLKDALRLRERLFPGETHYRLVFGESDFLPGLVVDRFGTCCVIQSYCMGMDVLETVIVAALKNVINPTCIIRKNDSALRAFEGLTESVETLHGKADFPLKVEQKLGEKTLLFEADPLQGQKTGFFFDQRDNRERLAHFAKGRSVLDCYSNAGGFGVYAAAAGAKSVTCVDSSKSACDAARNAFAANGLKAEVLQEDAEATLERCVKEKKKFDLIILDPPALAKSKKHVFAALRKYRKLNALALSSLNKDGLLFTCSCSHHVGRVEFIQMINEAGIEAGRAARILELRGASGDHPVLPAMPETEYLKCAVVKAD